jgi:hypothetical protein
MPVGPITPGSPVVVTPDPSPLARLASMMAPTATMAVTAAHIQALTLALLNVQDLDLGNWQRGTPTPGITSGGSLPTWSTIGGNAFEQIDLSEPILYVPLFVPNGAVMATIAVYLKAIVTHGGSLPATMPSVTLLRYKPSDATAVAYGPAVDPSASIAAYKAMHTITLAPAGPLAAPVANDTYLYYLSIIGEMDANSEVGLLYSGTKVAIA